MALDRDDFCTDMWRGSTWINTDWMIVEGLRRHGQQAAATELARRCVDGVLRWYEEEGCIFEFYDPHDRRSPTRLDRKGPIPEPYDCRRKIPSIRDYHWSAALTFRLLLDGIGTA